MSDIHDRFKLKNLKLAGGDETHRFEAVLVMFKTNGSPQQISHVSNGGTGGPDMHYPIKPITNQWMRDKLEPSVQRGLITYYKEHPEECQSFSGKDPLQETLDLLKGSHGCIDWLVSNLINRHYAKREQAKRDRAIKSGRSLGGFKAGDKVYLMMSRMNPTKILAKVVKVNRKTLGVETLEATAKYPVGTGFRGPPSLCRAAP